MTLKNTKRKIYTLIKVISLVLITSAIGLELWNIYEILTHSTVLNIPNPIFWIERFAITSHLIEGFIAAYYAHSRNKKAVTTALILFLSAQLVY